MNHVDHQAAAYPGFRRMKRLVVFLFLPEGMLVQRGIPQALSSPVPIYTPGWIEAL